VCVEKENRHDLNTSSLFQITKRSRKKEERENGIERESGVGKGRRGF
jgi:hypothetical protein